MQREFLGVESGQIKAKGFYSLINDDLLLEFVDSKALSSKLLIGIKLNVTNL